MSETSIVERLDQESYLALTTFRRNGAPVTTPVWAAAANGKLYIYTPERTGKVKRLRHTSRVTLAPCDRQGKIHGDAVEATARLLDKADLAMVRRVMTAKYGWQFRLFKVVSLALRFVPKAGPPVGAEVSVGGPGA